MTRFSHSARKTGFCFSNPFHKVDAVMKKKTVPIIFYSVYCVLAVVGFLLDFRLPGGKLTGRPFVYYTSLSNMACSLFMLAALVHQFRHGSREFCPKVKFVFVIMILVTCIVYNLLLNGYGSWQAYFADVKNSLYHLILPVLFVLDWLLFYRRGRVTPGDPLLAVIPPALYAVYIVVRAAVADGLGITLGIRYPYFFLNIDRLGWDGFALWTGILLAALLALGYSLYALDRLLSKRMVLLSI